MTAAEKIKSELSGAKLSAKGKAVAPAVSEALATFCAQNAEFAQAVEQSAKTAAECVESTVKNCGGSISDIEVYRKAVQFYFEGATVHFNMSIDLGDEGFSNIPEHSEQTPETTAAGGLSLSLDDLLL